jgi:hypothetical protein
MPRPERAELVADALRVVERPSCFGALRPGARPSLAIERRQVAMDDRQARPYIARGLLRRSPPRPERVELVADALRAVERPSCARAASARCALVRGLRW